MAGKGQAALRVIGRRLNASGDGGIDTDAVDSRVYCVICGRPVRSKLGAVCSRPACHDRYLARFED